MATSRVESLALVDVHNLEPERGIEPPTFALQKHCSTVELLRRISSGTILHKMADFV